MATLPTLFISHGSPMHALHASRASEGWRALAKRIPKPRAVLIASAHWETAAPQVSLAPQPETIHDFGGFPEALYHLTYPAPGAPDVAQAALALLERAGLPAQGHPSRGLDHGAWVPLRYLYPDADVPVVQVSVQSQRDCAHHLQLGRALAPLVREGVLIIGSGHLTHNLREFFTRMSSNASQPTERYVAEFSQWVHATLTNHDENALTHWLERAPHARRAHPTAEHFLPLPFAYGAASGVTHAPPSVERIELGVDAGVLAMDAYWFGAAP